MAGTLDVIQELEGFPLFAGLRPADLEWLRRSVFRADAPKGTPLYRQGDLPRHLFVLLRGRVKVIRHSHAGREFILDVHAAPAVLGEFAAYTGRPHLMTAVALEPCAVALVPRRILRRLADAHPRVAAHLLEIFQQRYEHLSERIEGMAGAPVEQRLARLLVYWRDAERATPDGERVVPLGLTRRELAELIATTPETVVRLLTRWKRGAAIATRGDGIVVRAWEPIERLARGERGERGERSLVAG